MESSIEKKLCEMPTSQLVKIIQAALTTMNETEQISFIAKYIDARTSLTRLGANDPAAFLDEVEAFCLDCLNCAYYSDENDIETYFAKNYYNSYYYNSYYYDYDWDYDEYYANTEWAGTFAKLFKLSMMYIQSGDFETGYEATSRLLSCLNEMMRSDNFLGTDNPMSYISTDWNDLFILHYEALFQCHPDPDRAIKMAFRWWMDFGSYCDEGFLNNAKDAVIAARYILEEIKASKKWARQRQCFELLARLHSRLGEEFDKTAQASALIDYNVYFYLMVVEDLCEKKLWHEAVETACTALPRIQLANKSMDMAKSHAQNEVRAAIQSKLADAYEQLSDFALAFDTAKCMFMESPLFTLYKRARALAEKLGSVSAFLALAEQLLGKKGHSYGVLHNDMLRDIYSYEGEAQKLMDMAKSQKIDLNYYTQKYIALSFVYRALNNVPDAGDSLAEYISSGADQDGIADMILSGDDALRRSELLRNGEVLLQRIIAFHINAATRNRYAKAAYYVCVVRDIHVYLGTEDDFRQYFQEVIQQNSRRPALRDEMSIVYGKEAVMVKKRT